MVSIAFIEQWFFLISSLNKIPWFEWHRGIYLHFLKNVHKFRILLLQILSIISVNAYPSKGWFLTSWEEAEDGGRTCQRPFTGKVATGRGICVELTVAQLSLGLRNWKQGRNLLPMRNKRSKHKLGVTEHVKSYSKNLVFIVWQFHCNPGRDKTLGSFASSVLRAKECHFALHVKGCSRTVRISGWGGVGGGWQKSARHSKFAQNKVQNNVSSSYELKPKKNRHLAWISYLYLRGLDAFSPTPSRLTPELLEII